MFEHSTVLALFQDAPRRREAPVPLRGILDSACARRSAE